MGAVTRFREDDGATFFFIETIAVADHWRGHRIGDEAVDEVITAMSERALEKQVTSAEIQAKVHRDNKPSLALLQRWGFREQWRDGDYLAFSADVYFGSA